MEEKHVIEELSAYIDEALKGPEREHVKKHLDSCKKCRAEFESLARVSRLVSSLPQRELPTGFLQRLERKRRDTAQAQYKSAPWFPAPARLAACAATTLLLGFVFFREVRYRLAPAILGTSASADTRAFDEIEGEDLERVLKQRRAAKNKGAWNGPRKADVEKASAPPLASAKRAARRAPQRARLSSLGSAAKERSGTGAPPQLAGKTRSNQELHELLEEQKRQLGIKKIVPPPASAPPSTPASIWDGIPNRPMDRKEAMSAMRGMASRLERFNEQYRWKTRPLVPLAGGSTPGLIGTTNDSHPLGTTASSMKTVAYTGGSAGSVTFAATKGEAEKKSANLTKPLIGKRKAESQRPAAPPKPLKWDRQWSGIKSGMHSGGGGVIKTQTHLTDLFMRIAVSQDAPKVDFTKDMALAVFAGHSPTDTRRIEIVSVSEENGRLVIRYRIWVGKEKGPSSAYHIVVVPRSDLPPNFLLSR